MYDNFDYEYDRWMERLVEEEEIATAMEKQNVQPQDKANYDKWCAQFPEWPWMSASEKKKIKVKFQQERKRMQKMKSLDELTCLHSHTPTPLTTSGTCVVNFTTPNYSLGSCTVTAPNMYYTGSIGPAGMQWVAMEQKEETEITMHDHTEENQRYHLNRRLNNTVSDKRQELKKVFNIEALNFPETVKEAKELIAKGWLQVNGKDEERFSYDPWYYHVEFRDPAKPKDQDGYEKATEAMDVAKTAATDDIAILAPAEGLKSLREFESKTFH